MQSAEGKVAIEQTRTILDLHSQARKIKVLGSSSIKVAVTELKAIRSLPIVSLKEVPNEEIKSEFRTFIVRLKELSKELSMKVLENTDPKKLIKKFVDSAGELSHH